MNDAIRSYILIYFGTSLMSLLFDNAQEHILVNEILPSNQFQLIDLGHLDEKEFEGAETYLEVRKNNRYELIDRHQYTEDKESLIEYIDNITPANETVEGNLVSNLTVSDEKYISHPNSEIISQNEYFKFSNPICDFLFTNYRFDIKSLFNLISYISNGSFRSKSYYLVLKLQINSIKQFAMLPLIFTKDEYIVEKAISFSSLKESMGEENYDYELKEFFYNMEYVSKFNFSVINLKKFAMLHVRDKSCLENHLVRLIRDFFTSFDYVYNKDNIKMIIYYTELIYNNKVNLKIPKMIIVSLIMIKINNIPDKIDIIILYKCLFDILTKIQKENVVKCLIKLLIHLIIYYTDDNRASKYLNLNYFSDRTRFLLNCCNLYLSKDFSCAFRNMNTEIQQSFAVYYIQGLSKDKIRKLLEIHAFLFNFLTEEYYINYYNTIIGMYNSYDAYNETIFSISSANIQTVIKILEDNKIID